MFTVDVLLALLVLAMIGWFINENAGSDLTVKTTLRIALGLVIVGMLLWLINTYVPMARSIKAILNIVVVIATCIRVLQAAGLWSEAMRLWYDVRYHRVPRA